MNRLRSLNFVNIVIDHREPVLFRELFADDDHISLAQLPVGDFRVDDRWVFERKTISDLCISIVDGRLFSQAMALLKAREHPVVILEGRTGQSTEKGVRREAVQGAIIALTVFFGLPVLRALNPEETVRLIRYTVQQGFRFAEGGVFRGGYRPKGLRARKLYVLQGLPGVGRKRAEVLLWIASAVSKPFFLPTGKSWRRWTELVPLRQPPSERCFPVQCVDP